MEKLSREIFINDQNFTDMIWYVRNQTRVHITLSLIEYLLFKLYDVYIYIKERKVHVIIRKEIFPSK